MLIFRSRIRFLDSITFYSKKKRAFWELDLFIYSGSLVGEVGVPFQLGLPFYTKHRNMSAPEMLYSFLNVRTDKRVMLSLYMA
jgi:hypothetical protein